TPPTDKLLSRTRAVSGQFDAHAVPLGLMVRSRDLRPPRFRRLVRGVSNHVAAPCFETGASRRFRSWRRMFLRPPQDEADKRPRPFHPDPFAPGTAWSNGGPDSRVAARSPKNSSAFIGLLIKNASFSRAIICTRVDVSPVKRNACTSLPRTDRIDRITSVP